MYEYEQFEITFFTILFLIFTIMLYRIETVFFVPHRHTEMYVYRNPSQSFGVDSASSLLRAIETAVLILVSGTVCVVAIFFYAR